jgi:hypothetical protein
VRFEIKRIAEARSSMNRSNAATAAS